MLQATVRETRLSDAFNYSTVRVGEAPYLTLRAGVTTEGTILRPRRRNHWQRDNKIIWVFRVIRSVLVT